jgi:alpha 1,2-mannosyltransferase
MKEMTPTIPSLWHHVREFTGTHPAYLAPGNSLKWISRSRGATYNLCHCWPLLLSAWACALNARCAVWSNFEIADLDFFRSKVYMEFFEHLDKAGGFYYEVRFSHVAASPAVH